MKRTVSIFFAKFDILSKEVKLNSCTTNDSRYQTAFGGILSIIAFCLTVFPAIYMFNGLFIRTSPKAYEVTRFIDDTPKIVFDNSNAFFILRFYSPSMSSINETFIKFYGQVRSAKTGKVYGNYGFDKCNYAQHFKGVEDFFPSTQKGDLEYNYFCLSKMFLNGSYILVIFFVHLFKGDI